MKCFFRLSGSFLPALVLAACATPPPAPEPAAVDLAAVAFDGVDTQGVRAGAVPADWWRGFDDPHMTGLVEAALASNRDIAVAAANIAAARTLLANARLEQSPSTSTNAAGELARAPRAGADTELGASGQLSASWEYDAFGRIAALIESREVNLVEQEELRRDVAVTVAAETALAYADLRGAQVRLEVARSNAELQRDSLDLLATLFENGRATRLDLDRAEAQFRTTLSTLPQLEAQARLAGARLATLTGQPSLAAAPAVAAALETTGPIPSPPDALDVETPEALIRRRPDIRAAEAQIAELLALGEVERARLFPTLTFNANLLSLLSEGNDAGDSLGFAVGPAIRWDGPDLRRVRGDIDLADANTRVALAAYERDVLEALGEVEAALIGLSSERARRADLEQAAAAAERATSLARLRFEEGLDDFLDVIDAQRSLLDAQDRLQISQLETTRQAILAYRALGGIWPAGAFAADDTTGDQPNG